MKKTLFILISALLILALSVSCSGNVKDCIYCYFNDTAFILVFNQSDNMLYRIELPLDLIVDYGKAAGLETVPQAIEEFTGLKKTLQVVGTPDTYKSLERILDCWIDGEPDKKDYLDTLVLYAQDLSNEPLLSKINKLCGTDVSDFLKHLTIPGIKTADIKCENFLNFNDPPYSRKYFQKWVKQIMGD